MRKLLAIGVGVGDPGYVTAQAVEALREVDVFFVLDKGAAADDLTQARREICERYLPTGAYRTVHIVDPPRDRTATDYAAAVESWREERARAIEQAIGAELDEDGCGGFLVWGDPSLYDGTIRVFETLLHRGVLEFEYEVIPGISSIHALTARHRITLNRVAGAVHITTGRRLADGFPDNAADVVVMLDADLTCARFRDQDIEIYWGAYLGTPDEVLIAGPLGAVIDEIGRTRHELRERKGWIMDTYLLRRGPTEAL
ncbi:MAG TPA: precorrin-6A synthase (deacetylating) [Mycobacteriales bacterium]|jgi:precorrin-6A synthase|nr:precorrin-6A synthase (deacetylating) [Mycobacteriales bacterium]